MFLFYKKEILLMPFAQVRESPGKSWNFDAKSPEKAKKMSWKVLESHGIRINFLVGTMAMTKYC